MASARPSDLAGQTALVVGGTGGIGAATARYLAAAGARVAITHRPGKAQDGQAVLSSLAGSEHLALPCDVGETSTITALRDEIEQRFGSLHILVNASGFTKPVPHADLDALDDELIDAMFRVNWRGQFATVRAFAPMLKASRNGLIVSISSVSGTTGSGSSIVYCATKAAIDVMTKSLARALAPEIRVMAVAPAAVATGFVPGRDEAYNRKAAAATPLKRIAEADDVARAVLACASHLGYATGQTIILDGGRSLA